MDFYGWHTAEPLFIGYDGRVLKTNPRNSPYGYDPYFTYQSPDFNRETDDVCYSDRLMQWDMDKFNSICKGIWGNTGQYFDNRRPTDIETFLCDYFGREVILTAILKGCNYGNGYPYWVFAYRDKES